jgi:DNA-binding winged helix-turn-helix (wHTH) protein/tetratricopeptide (TPR) repeat protein
LQFGDFSLDRAGRTLIRSSQPLALPTKAFDLLVYLAENPGRPLSKDELMKSVWPDSIVEEANLSHNMFLIRKALGSEAGKLIVTLPGRGYQFTAHVTEAASAAPQAPAEIPATYTATLEATRSHLIFQEETEDRIAVWKSPLAMGFIVVALALLATTAWLGWQRYEDHIGGPPVQVVVSDFDGGTGDPALDRTLKDLLRFNLGQSQFVNVLPASLVRSTMTLMRHSPNDRLTTELARDICERTGSQAILHGNLARAGNGYVVTEEATNCVDGVTLGVAKQEVSRSDDLPRAMDRIGASLRHDLGESRRMIARFNKPLSAQQTESIEALKSFSQAGYLSNSGHFAESNELLQQAVALDPKFATAYFNLYANAANMGDQDAADNYLKKAYDLREFTTEPVRLVIVSNYESIITGDLYESLRNDLAWTQLYPRNPLAWNALSTVYMYLLRFPEAVDAAKHHLQLLPTDVSAYTEMASAQIDVRDFAGARKTCEAALAHGFDTEFVHLDLLMVGHITRDAALIAEQERWLDNHPDSPKLWTEEASYALFEGSVHRSLTLLDRMEDAFRHQGSPSAGTRVRQTFAGQYAEIGEIELAKKERHLAPVDPGESDELAAMAEIGETEAAATLLRKQLSDNPDNTVWNTTYAPLIRAKIALHDQKPADALAALQPLVGTNHDLPYVRGEAYLQANQFPQAEASFRQVLAHAEIIPTSYILPLSELGLARALAHQGKTGEAISAYESFFNQWRNADKNLLVLQAAQKEFATLHAPVAAKHEEAELNRSTQ